MKFKVVVESEHFDSACIHDILKEAMRHGTVTQAVLTVREPETLPQMYVVDQIRDTDPPVERC